MPDTTVAADQLTAYIDRIEALEHEKKTLTNDISEVYAEAKGNGFDPKIMREIVKLRRMDESDRSERESLIDTYKRALGMEV